MTGVQLDLHDIQGIVFYSFADQPHAAYLHIHFAPDPALGREWLASLAPEVTRAWHAKHDRRGESVQVAFTAAGLEALGVPADVINTFGREFYVGMNSQERAKVLGDLDGDPPSGWEFGAPSQTPIHAVLILFARSELALSGLRARHVARLASANATIVHEDTAALSPNAREHFGFHDGISQPNIEGSPRSRKRAIEPEVPAGEFLLGYRNAYGNVPPTPRYDGADIGQNGTFLVYRALRQDVAAFWNAVYERARPRPGENSDDAAARLAAALVGRWPSGAPLVRHPDHDVASSAGDNQFGFAEGDADGHKCPFGAHIRRANPRDMLTPGPVDSLAEVSRHRLIRRGRPYGPPLEGARGAQKDDGKDRGLIFVALNASLRRQFEFIQQTWVNNPNFAALYDEADPLLGIPKDGEGRYTLPGDPVRRRLSGLPRVVSLRGGAYFFLPGIRALTRLSQHPPTS